MNRSVCFAGFAILLTFVSASAAAPSDPGVKTPAAEHLRECVLPDEIVGTVTLPNECRYSSTLEISHSNTHVDCSGAVFSSIKARAVVIRPGVENVSVRNCLLLETGGLLIEGHRLESAEASRDEARKLSSSGVVISDMTIRDSYMTGIFVDHFVVGATIENSEISGGATVGIYLEYGSQKNVIRGNLIAGNGHVSNDGLPRVAMTRREGLSIDASAENTVEDNVFDGNAIGGVFLYKNCWEYHTTNFDSLPRFQHARDNLIRRNVFRNMPVGVWIAARQSRDLLNWDCGDQSPYDVPVSIDSVMEGRPESPSDDLLSLHFNLEFLTGLVASKYGKIRSPFRSSVTIYEDFAEDNSVVGNCFTNVGTGVRVEDDGAAVAENRFIGDFEYVYLGTPFRSQLLGRPVEDTVIRDNSFYSPSGRSFSENAIVIEGEHTGTDFGPQLKLARPGQLPCMSRYSPGREASVGASQKAKRQRSFRSAAWLGLCRSV